jgi:dTDP-4-amino-4,6-dideoxygalactose transaminase
MPAIRRNLSATWNNSLMLTIPFVNLKAQYEAIKPEIDGVIAQVINEASFIGGHFVQEFESEFGRRYGARNVISCANGSDSLYILMRMLGIGAGDEVITAANSWISNGETISQTGARPVFIDVDADFYSIDEWKVEARITEKTKALIPVHLHGQVCEMEKLQAICQHHNLFMIEDCAQAHFSSYKNTLAGLFGNAGSFSFYPTKNLGAYGDAGAIITGDDSLALQCRMYTQHGSLTKHEHQIEGINSRLDALQAAVLKVKLSHIESWIERRIYNASLYDHYLGGIEEIILPKVRPNTKHSFHLYVIRAQERNELKYFLKANHIETALHYPRALPNLAVYNYLGYKPSDFPVATQLEHEILSLPMYPELAEDMISYIATKIKAFYKKG